MRRLEGGAAQQGASSVLCYGGVCVVRSTGRFQEKRIDQETYSTTDGRQPMVI